LPPRQTTYNRDINSPTKRHTTLPSRRLGGITEVNDRSKKLLQCVLRALGSFIGLDQTQAEKHLASHTSLLQDTRESVHGVLSPARNLLVAAHLAAATGATGSQMIFVSVRFSSLSPASKR